MSIRARTQKSKVILITAILAITALLDGCSKQAFLVTASQELQSAPGTFKVPPKVDIVLVEDDTGSMFEAYPEIAQQMPVFLNTLDSYGWDYHFTTIPLTTNWPVTQVTASKYDPSYGSLWQPQYPGEPMPNPGDPGTVNPNVFIPLSQYNGFINNSDISNGLNGQEPGFSTIETELASSATGTGLLRNDALTIIVVVGNGNDTSGVTMCTRSDGYVGPCDLVGQPDGSMEKSFLSYEAQFKALKPNPGQVLFYAAVASEQVPNCLGGGSYIGTRYQQMAAALGGQSYDVCSQPIPQILSNLATSLQDTRQNYIQDFLMISQEPNVDTITVTKYPNADTNNPQIIPRDTTHTNGWDYMGYETVDLISSPVPMDQATGYAIELFGPAVLQGSDTANVNYKPVGQNSSTP